MLHVVAHSVMGVVANFDNTSDSCYPHNLTTPQVLACGLRCYLHCKQNDNLNKNYYSLSAGAVAHICLTDWKMVLRLCPSISSIIPLIGAINWSLSLRRHGGPLQQVLLVLQPVIWNAGGVEGDSVFACGSWRWSATVASINSVSW